MSKNLYFIPIIERALQGKDPESGLQESFRRIIQIGREPGYRRAFNQFQRFMEEVKNAHGLLTGEEQLDRCGGALMRRFPLNILIEKEEQAFGTFLFDRMVCSHSIKNVMPGEYRIKMGTGRIIWEGPITEKDCIWKMAYPRQSLKLAADTGEQDQQPARTVSLLGDTVLLHFYPGIETGVLTIELREASGE